MSIISYNTVSCDAFEGENTQGVPDFWLTIFKNVDMLAEMVQVCYYSETTNFIMLTISLHHDALQVWNWDDVIIVIVDCIFVQAMSTN